MTGRANKAVSPQTDEIRAYIMTMAAELAEMADDIQEPALADNLRDIAWPSRGQMSAQGPN